MSPAYTFAVNENLPDAVHVFDRFHIMKLFNEKLSDLRREVQKATQTNEQKDAVKGTRWLLLKNKENLNDDKDERARLDKALEINKPLYTAYYLKEDLRQLWNKGSKHAGEKFLDKWIARASSSGVRILKKFANTIQQHKKGLLAWYDYRIRPARWKV